MSSFPENAKRPTSGPEVGYDREVAKTKVAEHYRDRISAAAPWFKDLYERAESNYRFVAGGKGQWNQADWKNRRAKKQPALSMNDTALAINAVSGREVTQRFQTTFSGRNVGEEDDQRYAEVFREVDRWTLERARAAEMESDAFRDLLVVGFKMLGWRIDYMDDWRGQLRLESYDPWQCIWDPMACEPNRVDREWDAVGRYVSLDSLLAMFPEHAERINKERGNKAVWLPDASESTGGRWPWVYQERNQYFDKARRAIFLSHYQWRERAPAYLIHPVIEGSEGSSIDTDDMERVTKEQFDEYMQEVRDLQLNDAFDGGEVPYIGPEHNFFRWSYREAFFVGHDPLEVRDIPYDRFTRNIMTGIPLKSEDRTDVQSLCDLMKDGQRFKNAILSYAVSHFSKGRKGGTIYTKDTFGRDAEIALETVASDPDPWIPAQPGSDLKSNVMQLNTNEFPAGAAQLIELAEAATWKATGLNPAALGQMADLRRVSGKVFTSVSEAGDVVLSTFFQSLRRYRQDSGALRLAMYNEHFDEERVGRIVGPTKAQALPPAEMWDEMLHFDVIVDESESSRSEQMQLFDLMTRTGMLENLISSGQLPMQIFINMIPSNAITETDRQVWLQRVQGDEASRIVAQLREMAEEDPDIAAQVVQQAIEAIQAAGAPQDNGTPQGGEQ